MKLLGILLVVVTSSVTDSLKQCTPDVSTVSNHYLKNHVMSTGIVSDIYECVTQCSLDISCKSINFHLSKMSCDLNAADRYSHPQDYVMNPQYLYMDAHKLQRKVFYSNINSDIGFPTICNLDLWPPSLSFNDAPLGF